MARARAEAAMLMERTLRDQLEQEQQKSKAVQKFLQDNLLAQEDKSRSQQKAEANVRETELLVKKEAERLEQAKVAQEKLERRKLEQQERRTMDLMKAREQLTQEIKEFQRQADAEYAKSNAAQEGRETQKELLDLAQQELDRETHAAEKQANPDLKKLKFLKQKRDDLKTFARMYESPSTLNYKARLEAQLKLREKLLLEVEEKLLRMQLKLDEK